MATQTVFELQMEELRIDMREMRTAVTEMAKAMSKLAVLEERNLASTQAIDRVCNRVEKVEVKVNAIEIKQITSEATVDGVMKTMKVMWAVFGFGVIAAGIQLFKLLVP